MLPANRGPDVLSSAEGMTAYLDGHKLDTFPTARLAWQEAKAAARRPTDRSALDSEADELLWVRNTRRELGNGISHNEMEFIWHERPGEPFVTFGTSDAFSLQIDHGEISISLDRSTDFARIVELLFPDGSASNNYPAATWVQIGQLLRNDEIFAFLLDAAARDAIADEAESRCLLHS